MATDKRVIGRDLSHDDYALGSDATLKIGETASLGSGIGEGWSHAVDTGAKVMKQAANLLGVAPANVACRKRQSSVRMKTQRTGCILTKKLDHFGMSERLSTSTFVTTVLLVVVATRNEVLSFGKRCGAGINAWNIVQIHGGNAGTRSSSPSL